MNEYSKKKQGQRKTDLSYGQIQPQAPEVEKAVLGALMIDKDAYVVVCETLKSQSFYETRHQKIYEAIERLSINEKPIDVLTVTEQLAKDGTLEEVGGGAYVAELSSKVATSANIVFHANIIAEKYLSRQLINYTNTIGAKAFDETLDVKDVIMEAERILFEIAQTNMKKDYTSIKTLVGMSTPYRPFRSSATAGRGTVAGGVSPSLRQASGMREDYAQAGPYVPLFRLKSSQSVLSERSLRSHH